MQQPKIKYMSPEEYLALEEAAEFKSEYYQGEIFNMAGASISHNRIAMNLSSEINIVLKNTKCQVFMSDMRIWISSKEFFTYPDILVVCNIPEFYSNRNDTITNPLIIIEVLSKSTENYDRGNKFLFYRSIPTFQEYILIDQYSVHIEHFYIGVDGNWILKEYDHLNDILKFTKIDFQIPLKDIYSQVEFD